MSIDKNDLRKYITKSFIKNRSISFNDDTSLFEEGIIDSLGVLQLLNYIEEKYGFTALDEELIPQNLDSINRLDIYISSKLENIKAS